MMIQTMSGWSYVIVGTVLVGVGGSLATLGWNKIRSQEQWRNAMVGVVRELALNDRMVEAATALAKRWPRRSEIENFSYESYQGSHLTAMVTSGHLDPENPEDLEVLGALEAYQQAISRFNAALRIVGRLNPGLFIRKDLIHTTDAETWPAITQDVLAEPFRDILRTHQTTKRVLERRYPWATSKK